MGGLIHLPQLAVQQQPASDPLEKYGQLLSIQKLAAGQQLQQSQIQNAQLDTQTKQLEVAQTQRDANDQQAVNKAFMDSGGDPQKFQQLLPQYGASFGANQKVQQGIIAHQNALAGLDESTFKATKEANQILGQHLQSVLSAPPEDQPAQYALELNAIKRNPQLAKYATTIPPQFPGADSLKQTEISLGMNDALYKAADEQRKQQTQDAELPGKQAESALKQSQLKAVQGGGVAPGVPLENQEAQAWLDKNPGKNLADYQKYAKTLVPAFNFQLQTNGVNTPPPKAGPDGAPLTGDELYHSFGQNGPTVKAIVEGRKTLPSGAAMRSPYWQNISNQVMQADPEWSEQRAQVRKAFTTGKDGANIGNLNTAAVHLDALGEAAKAMDNGSFQPGNAIYNKIKTMFGSSAPTTAEAIKTAASGEMAAALKGNATDPEIAQLKSNYNVAGSSPKQIADVIDSHLGIIGQKLQTYKERYEQQMPGDSAYSPVLPSAQAVFAKHAAGPQNQPSTKAGGAPAGATHIGVGSADKKKHYLDASGHDLGLAE
jgi:hypothetical protein